MAGFIFNGIDFKSTYGVNIARWPEIPSGGQQAATLIPLPGNTAWAEWAEPVPLELPLECWMRWTWDNTKTYDQNKDLWDRRLLALPVALRTSRVFKTLKVFHKDTALTFTAVWDGKPLMYRVTPSDFSARFTIRFLCKPLVNEIAPVP